MFARRVGLLRTDDRERSIYVRGGLLLNVRSGTCVRPLVQLAVCRSRRRARGGSIRGTGSAGVRDGLVPHVREIDCGGHVQLRRRLLPDLVSAE